MLCLPIFDLPTRSSSGYLLRYILPRTGPRFLTGPMARNPFFSALVVGSDVVIGTGHGDPDEYSGFWDSEIWKVGKYDPRQVQGKVVKLVSCDCGAELGPDLVKNGCLSFAGYDSDLLWLVDPIYRFNPWDDPDAIAIMGPIVAGLNVLLDGATCQEAFDTERAGFLANMGKTDFELQQDLLQYDYDHSVLYGDPGARINPRPNIKLPFPPPPMLL